MTRLVRLSGNVLLALIVACALYGGYVIFKIKRDNADAARFTAEAVTAFATGWNAGELARRAAPEWLSPHEIANLPALFTRFAAMGKLKALHPPTGRVGNGPYPGTMINGVWAQYDVIGEFDTGPSRFRMVLKRVGDNWQIAGLQVSSNAAAGGN